MTTIRVAHRDRYLVLEQRTIRDPLISLRALGLLVKLLDRPDNWRISADEIWKMVREGRDAVRFAISELEIAGYLVRHKYQDHRGHWVTELVLYEHPQLSTDESTDAWKSGVGATRGNTAKGHVAPTPGKPVVGGPVVGFPGANRNTGKKDCVDENSATGITGVVDQSNTCTLCSGLGWVGFDEDTRTWQNKCSCVNASRRRRR